MFQGRPPPLWGRARFTSKHKIEKKFVNYIHKNKLECSSYKYLNEAVSKGHNVIFFLLLQFCLKMFESVILNSFVSVLQLERPVYERCFRNIFAFLCLKRFSLTTFNNFFHVDTFYVNLFRRFLTNETLPLE